MRVGRAPSGLPAHLSTDIPVAPPHAPGAPSVSDARDGLPASGHWVRDQACSGSTPPSTLFLTQEAWPPSTAPHVWSDALWPPARPHLQPLGAHGLAHPEGWSHGLKAGRCDCPELLCPPPPAPRAGLRLGGAASWGASQGGDVGMGRRRIMGRAGQHRKSWGHGSAGQRRRLLCRAKASGQLCPALLSTPTAPPHVTPSDDLAPAQGRPDPPQTPLHLYPVFARVPPPRIFPPSSPVL